MAPARCRNLLPAGQALLAGSFEPGGLPPSALPLVTNRARIFVKMVDNCAPMWYNSLMGSSRLTALARARGTCNGKNNAVAVAGLSAQRLGCQSGRNDVPATVQCMSRVGKPTPALVYHRGSGPARRHTTQCRTVTAGRLQSWLCHVMSGHAMPDVLMAWHESAQSDCVQDRLLAAIAGGGIMHASCDNTACRPGRPSVLGQHGLCKVGYDLER